jgi:AraC family transcriptional regulator
MSKGRARLAMSQGVSVWVLDAPHGFGDAAFHAHHAIQITASLAGELMVATLEETLRAPCLAIAADEAHRFEAHGLLAFIFVEPESVMGRALTATLFDDRPLVGLDPSTIMPLLQSLEATFEQSFDNEKLLTVGRAVVEQLAPGTQGRLPDPRIQKIIDHAAAHLDEPLSLESASRGIYLSPSRLRHLFVEQTGLAFKTYVLWLRLVRAVQAYAEGSNLTEAAHAAGFSDSAHFSRIFRRTFGLPATTLTRL